ncbi:helix-turn-helix domain-containing protein [Demequina sp. SO4-13]
MQCCQHRPVAHVAAEAGVSRACLSKRKSRFEREGEQGLQDRCSAPFERPAVTESEVVDMIEAWRREHYWTARAIRRELVAHGHTISLATVGGWLKRLRISRFRHLDPDG